MAVRIVFPQEHLAQLCRRWRLREMALFSSVLRDDFGLSSDVDVLVSFEADATWDLFDLMDMREELIGFFGRPVDLVEQEGLRNPYRRREILRTREVVYAA